MDKEYTTLLSSYPEHVREYLQSMLRVKDSVKPSVSRVDEDCFCVKPSCLRENSRESELNLGTLEATKARQTVKCKYALGMPRNETDFTCKTNDAASKIRKRKGKLRNSISKSTVTTKDTYLLGRKETKKRRNKGENTNQHRDISHVYSSYNIGYFLWVTETSTYISVCLLMCIC